MPTRVIRDSLLDSERYHACGVESRLLFIELVLCADDYGLVPLNVVFLRRHTTVCDGKAAAQTAGFLQQLIDHGLLIAYDSERGARFAFIPRFGNTPRARKPKWPLPPYPIRNEINDLQKKRTTDVVHMHANVLETGTETGTEVQDLTGVVVSHPVGQRATIAEIACPVEKIVALWAECLPNLPQPLTITKERRQKIKLRWRWIEPDNEADGLTWLRSLFVENIGRSKFLTGRSPPTNGRPPFKASIDFVFRSEQQFAEISEGKYA